jgi:Ig-like domain CHU_C associated
LEGGAFGNFSLLFQKTTANKMFLNPKFFYQMKKLLYLFMALMISQNLFAARYFVKANATGLNNGTSWTNAFTSLQSALAVATSVDEVWVAAGIYKPSTSNKNTAFVIPSGLEVYGGFAGNETTLSSRNIALINTTNQTTLSGDLSGNDAGFSNQTDNSYRVVTFLNAVNTTTIDGFRILGGNNTIGNSTAGYGGGIYNNGSGSGRSSNPIITNCTITYCSAFLGGGIYNDGTSGGNASPTITKCTFISNQADDSGAGLANYGTSGNSSPTIDRCSFIGNSSAFNSGAMNNHGDFGISSPTITNCVFIGNQAAHNGGVMTNTGTSGTSVPTITNCSFSGNRADNVGSIIRNNTANPVLKNVIIWGNGSAFDNNGGGVTATYSLIQGGYTGTGNIDIDPLFSTQPNYANAPTTTGDLHTAANSPALNLGTNSGAPTTDLDGNTRPYAGTNADMGAYEFQSNCSQVANSTETMFWNGSTNTDWTNPCNWTPNGVPNSTNDQIIINATANNPIISSTATVRTITIQASATLTVAAGGTLNINDSQLNNLYALVIAGSFINNGTTNIIQTGTATGGITIDGSSSGTVTNNSTLTINVTNRALYIENPNKSITNNETGIINVTSNSGVHLYGSGSVFTNNGTYNYSGVSSAIETSTGSTFRNNSNVNISNGIGIRITTSSSFNNSFCAKFISTISGNTTIDITGSISNSGLIQNAGQINNVGTLSNGGVLKYGSISGNAISNNSVIVKDNPTPIFTYGGTFSGTVNGVFTDANATTLAGTFTAPNSFVPYNTLPIGSQTLYAKITLTAGGCTYIVPFTYLYCTITAPSSVSVSSTNICNGTSVTLYASCSTGNITWYNQLTGGTALGTVSGLNQSPASNTTYYAACKDGVCESSRVATSLVTVTAIPANPTAVSASSSNICNGSSVVLSANCSTGTVTWYNQLTGGISLGTGTGLSIIPVSTFTYYAVCKAGICESNRVATSQVVVTNTPNTPTSPALSTNEICIGSNVSLTATCTSSTINWYTSLTGGAAAGTGSPLTRTPSTTTTYYATCKSGACESTPRTSAGTVTVTPQPSSATGRSVNPTSICSGANTSLSATCATGTVTWYNTSSGGTSVGTGTGLSQSPTTTTTYYVSCKNGNCETTRASAGTVAVTASPTVPTGLGVSSTTVCSGSSVTLSATCATGTITWYNAATGGTSIGTGSSFNQSPTSNTTYYATCKSGTCESARTSAGTVTTTTQPTAPTALTTNPTAICSGASTSLSATCATGTVTWYNALTGGTSIGTGTGFSQSPSANTTYYATCKNGTCETARTSAGTVTVTTQPSVPTALSTSPATICSGTSTSLSATCATGTVTWYNAATGGTSIGTGIGFSQSPTSNTTYYATCKNGTCETARTLAGTVTVTTQPSVPTSLSVSSTAICSSSSISLSATCATGTVTWYNALTGGTSLGTGTGFSQSPSANTTYYATCKNGTCESARTSAGTVSVTTQPVNPTSVSVNNTTICSGSSVSLSATCSVGSVRWYNAATGGTSLGSTSPLTQSPTVNTTYYASCRNGSCESGRVATSQVVVADIPAIPSAASVNNTAICSGANVSLSATCASGTITWYNQSTGGTALGTGTGLSHSPTINTTYYASCENQCGASSRRATSQVVVTNIPTVPTSVAVNNTAICNGANVSLSATCASGLITWYNQATGGTALGTGTGLSQTPSANTTYYAVCLNNCGESSRVATNQVVVTPIPNAPTGVGVDNTSISAGNDINLSASCISGTITWYNTATGGSAIGTGSSLNYTPTPAGLYTFYAACESGTCKSSRVATSSVNVNGSVPNPTGVSVSQTAICVGNNVSLTANACSIGTLTWYNQATGGTSIGTDNPLLQTPAAGTITYYASCKDDVNESGRVATNAVTVTAIPVVATGVSASQTAICNGIGSPTATLSLSATCSVGAIKWYSQLSGGTAIGTGNGFTVSPTTTTTYYASCENSCGSSSRVATAEVVVTNIPTIPTGVNVNLTTISLGNNITLSATCVSGTLTWYNAATGGSSIGSGNSFGYTPPTAGNFSYYAACESGDCKSNRVASPSVEVIGSVPNPTAVTVSDAEICSSTSINLSANCSQGTVTWYNQATGGTSIGTGSPLAQSPTSTITYYASCKDGVNESGRVATSQVVVLTIPNTPTTVSVDNAAICNGTSVSLSATCASGTLTWYTQSSGGVNVGINTNLTQTPSSTTTYYAACENECGASSRVATSQVVVTQIPANPSDIAVSSTNISLGSSINLSATCTEGTLTWYSQTSGGTSIGTGNLTNYIPASAGSFIYYAACENGNCKSSRISTSQVNVNGTIPNPTTVEISQTAICVGQSISLSANCSVGTVIWYNQANSEMNIGSGSPLLQSPSAGTYTYYAACKDADIESVRVATNTLAVTAIPSNPTAVSVNNAAICSGIGSTVSLSATCASGSIVWYNQLSGGTAIGSGNNLSQSPTSTTTYYASCESGSCVSSRIATSEVVVTQGVDNPTNVLVSQTAICSGANVLLSATCTSGVITWYNEATGGTSIGTGTNLAQSPSATITYYASCKNGICESSRVASSQVQVTQAVTNPTGVSVNQTNICNGSPVTLSATCATGTINWYDSMSGAAELGTGNNFVQTPSVSTTYYATCENGICVSSKIATLQVVVTQNVNDPTSISVSNNNICSGTSVSLSATCVSGIITWYNSATAVSSIGTGNAFVQTPSNSIEYFVSCKDGICESDKITTGQIQVTQNVSNPTEVSPSRGVCSGLSVSLSATCATGTLTWYDAASGGAALGTGTNFSQSPSNTTTYYASCENGICISGRVSTMVTVNELPTVSIIGVDKLSCTTASVTRTASGGSIYVWSNGLGTNAMATVTSAGTYIVSVTNTNGCTATTTTTVTADLNLVVTASNAGPYSSGNTIELTASGANSYSWTGPNEFTSTAQNPRILGALVINDGIYTVVGVSGICSATATTNVTVNTGIDPCTLGMDYQFVKAGNPYQPLFRLTDGMKINQINEEVSIIAVPICPTVNIESVSMLFQGPSNNMNIPQSVSPYALFDNTASNIFGRVLTPGVYTLVVTGYSQDHLLGSVVYGPISTTFTILPTIASINIPTVSSTTLCSGSNFTVNFSTLGTFNPLNQFKVELSDASGNFGSLAIIGNTQNSANYVYPTIVGTSNPTGTVNCAIPNNIVGGLNYRIRVVSTDGVSVSPKNTSSILIHPKDLTFVSPTDNYSTNVGIKQASQKIVASNNVNSPAQVFYQAGKSIELNAGFVVEAGTVFKAEIKGCSN